MHRILIAISALALTGCTSAAVTNTAAPQYVTVPPELVAAGLSVSVLDAAPSGSVSLGSVKSLACQRLTSDPLPTAEYAAALLKKEAAAKGANALTDVSISGVSTVSIAGNCWANITATGTAFRVP